MVLLGWVYSLAILYTICLFSFTETLWGGVKPWQFVENMCVEKIC